LSNHGRGKGVGWGGVALLGRFERRSDLPREAEAATRSAAAASPPRQSRLAVPSLAMPARPRRLPRRGGLAVLAGGRGGPSHASPPPPASGPPARGFGRAPSPQRDDARGGLARLSPGARPGLRPLRTSFELRARRPRRPPALSDSPRGSRPASRGPDTPVSERARSERSSLGRPGPPGPGGPGPDRSIDPLSGELVSH